jgi:hypothetical protein
MRTRQHFDANRPILRHRRLGRLDAIALSQTQTKYTSRCMVDMSILIEHTKSGVEPSRITVRFSSVGRNKLG